MTCWQAKFSWQQGANILLGFILSLWEKWLQFLLIWSLPQNGLHPNSTGCPEATEITQTITAIRGWSYSESPFPPSTAPSSQWKCPTAPREWQLVNDCYTRLPHTQSCSAWHYHSPPASCIWSCGMLHGIQQRLSLAFQLLINHRRNLHAHAGVSSTSSQYCPWGIHTVPWLALGWQPSVWEISLFPHIVNRSAMWMILSASLGGPLLPLNKKWEKHWVMLLGQCKIMVRKLTPRKFRKLPQK